MTIHNIGKININKRQGIVFFGLNKSQDYKIFAALFIATIAAIFIGKSIATLPLKVTVVFLASLVIFFLSLLYTDLAVSILIFCMLLSPEIIIGSLPKRDIVIRVEDLLLVVFGVLWLARLAVDKSLRVLARTPINKYIAFYCAVFIFSTARGIITVDIHPFKGSFYVLKYLEYFVLYFLAVNIINSKKQIKMYLWAFLLTFAIVNIYAFTQIGLVDRVSAPFEGSGEPNTLGGYQILMLGITIGLLLHTASSRMKFLLVGLCLLTVIPFMHTLSRSSYMSILPMYLTFVVFHKSKRLFLIALLIIAVVFSVCLMPQKVVDRIKYTFIPHPQEVVPTAKIFGVALGPSASARYHSWVRVFENWKKSPYFGYGVTGLGFLDSQYIRTLAELGIVGFLAFIFLLGSIYRNTVRIYRNSKDRLFKGLALGFLAGHVGMVFHSFTANTYIIIRIMEPYWFLAAMVMMIPKLEQSRSEVITDPEEKNRYPRNLVTL